MCPKETILCELHEHAKCKVPNNMTKVCVVNSKDYVVSSEKGNLEEQ